jgi:undecaprenyl-diphosphatase
MSVLHAIVLGIVQGLTEFLPISSSGHLIAVPALLGWEEQPLAFDVALHLGTMLAVLLYFWRDFALLIRHGLADLARHGARVRSYSTYGRLALLILLGCVPAVIVGGLFNSWIEANVRDVRLVAVLLAVFGLLLLAAERWHAAPSGIERVDAKRTLLIGVAQAMALFPGVSRSGTTIAVGMLSGLSRAAAARFSFLLSAPVVVGAGLRELPDIRHAAAQDVSTTALATGFIAAFVSGLAAVHLLLRYLATRPLSVFAWYRFAAAGVILAVLALR